MFNHLLDGKIAKTDLPTDLPIFISSVQQRELAKTPNSTRRTALLSWLKELDAKSTPTATWVVGYSSIGNTRMGDGMVLREITRRLHAIKPKRKDANINDALIGEIAVKDQFILITNDGDLGDIVKSLGGCVLDLTS